MEILAFDCFYHNFTQNHKSLNNFYIQNSDNSNESVGAELYNAIGQMVLHQKIKGNERLYLNGLANGLYVLQLNHTYSFRLVVER